MPPAQYQSGYAVPKSSGLAIASLVLGIVGLCFWLPSIAAVICGHLALDKIRETNGAVGGKGLAIAGVVLGWIVLGATVVLAVIFAGFVVLR